jgi:hypothetical protein
VQSNNKNVDKSLRSFKFQANKMIKLLPKHWPLPPSGTPAP